MKESSTICVDASFILRLLLGGPGSEKAAQLWDSWKRCQIIAPALIFYEMANGLYRMAFHGVMPFETTREFLRVALDLGIKEYQEESLHYRALEIAKEFALPSTYDAHYLALAEMTESEFWTADGKLFNSIKSGFALIRSI